MLEAGRTIHPRRRLTNLIGDPATTPTDHGGVAVFDTSAIAGWTNDTSGGGITNFLTRLDCPRLHVLTGIGVRHHTGNGKIRDLRIYCRAVR